LVATLLLSWPTIAIAELWVALGDSITYRSAYAPPEGPWTQIVADGTGHAIINAGIDGSTTQDALKRLERDVLSHKPDRVLIMLGVNDHSVVVTPTPRHRVAPELFRDNLKKMVRAIKAAGAQVVLMSNRPMVLGDGPSRRYYLLPLAEGEQRPNCAKTLCIYNEIIRSVAAQQAATLIDIWQAVVNKGNGSDRDASIIKAGIDIPGDGFDGVHLGPGGHRLMADTVLKALNTRP
jgi:lysophospholipase L1-like esterase